MVPDLLSGRAFSRKKYALGILGPLGSVVFSERRCTRGVAHSDSCLRDMLEGLAQRTAIGLTWFGRAAGARKCALRDVTQHRSEGCGCFSPNGPPRTRPLGLGRRPFCVRAEHVPVSIARRSVPATGSSSPSASFHFERAAIVWPVRMRRPRPASTPCHTHNHSHMVPSAPQRGRDTCEPH